MKERVAVAMSGGVDSSVAAALLKQQGYEVIGMTMRFGPFHYDKEIAGYYGIKSLEDSRRVTRKLGIKHYILDFTDYFRDRIVRDFYREYLKGRTPNPCVRCNQYIKFGVLMNEAFLKDAEFLATGHYARIEKVTKSPACRTGRQGHKVTRYLLRKAGDLKKDQSYFLYRLNQKQLSHILFPLSDYTKEEVRKIAGEFDLPVADKSDSQEICFLGSADYREFLKMGINFRYKPGYIVDKNGKIIGEHKGIPFYTIGQRQGLGIALGYPAYVTKIDSKTNQITLGNKEDCYKSEFFIKKPYFISKILKKKIAVRVRIRYNHREAEASLTISQRSVRVSFKKPQFAITPGQSAVFYKEDIVLGGGVIDKVLG